MATKTAIMAGLLVLASSTAVLAQESYEGVVQNYNTDIRVQLILPEPPQERGRVHFGAPAMCDIPIMFTRTAEGARIYRFMIPNGGSFCDRLVNSDLMVRTDGEKIRLQFSGPRNGTTWTGAAQKE